MKEIAGVKEVGVCYHGASVGENLEVKLRRRAFWKSILMASVSLGRLSGRLGVCRRRGEKPMAFMSR